MVLTIVHIKYFLLLMVFFSCTAKIVDNLNLCSNNSVSCTRRFLPNSSALDSDCRLIAYRGTECAERKFVTSSSLDSLGTVRLKVYPFFDYESHTAFNVSMTHIKWTVFRFRFKKVGDNLSFCREYHLSPQYPVEEIFYDCLTILGDHMGSSFVFEYEAEDQDHNIEYKRFIHKFPLYRNIEDNASLQDYTPFLYVDITDSPKLTARWQQAPFPDLKYQVEIYQAEEGSEKTLVHSAVVEGTDNVEELSYSYNAFPNSGRFHVEIRVLSNKCTKGKCNVSVSPDLEIDGAITKTLLVGIVGCVVLLPLFLFIGFMWRRQCRPPTRDVKLPVVLIIHTPSRASHLKSVIALTEYLKNHCYIEALLDQLDVQSTKSKDPWTWCNNAFSRADFVMVVSSPPKCCSEEGIFRNMDLVALRFLKEKFSSGSSKPRFFSIMLPYCSKEDIPEEARNLLVFKLMRDFDQMLWFVHNGGKLPSVLNAAHMLLGPAPAGGKSELNTKGKILLTALKEAEFDRGKSCNCASNKNKGSNDDGDESTGFITSVNQLPLKIEFEFDYEREGHLRNVSESNSTSWLLRKPESPEFEETQIEFPDPVGICPRVTDLDLLQENDVPPVEVLDTGNKLKKPGFNVHALSL